MPPVPRLILAWLSPLSVALVIFVLSGRSHLPAPDILGFDKVAHFSAFALLAFLVTRALDLSTVRLQRAAILGAVLATLYGATDELHQMFTPLRSPDPFDLVADALGAASGASLWAWLRARRRTSP